jgi:Protein phosphatase 2C
MKEPWIVSKASVIGNSHIADNIPCQDSNRYKYFDEENFAIAAVSDGAGSASNSHIGSKLIVEKALELFFIEIKANAFNNKLPTKLEWEILCRKVFSEIYNILKEYAKANEIEVKSLAATVIVIVIVPYGLLISNIGDGRAGYLGEKQEWEACIEPTKGEYANETVFLTSVFEEIKTNLLINANIIEDKIRAFTLLTDGCESACFEMQSYNAENEDYSISNKPFKNFFEHNCKSLISYSEAGLTEEEIDIIWEAFLKDGLEVFKQESDDKTLILGVNKNNFIKK